jgi:hypothetical protein
VTKVSQRTEADMRRALSCTVLCFEDSLLWSEFVATDAEIAVSISGETRFSEVWRVWNGVHSAS